MKYASPFDAAVGETLHEMWHHHPLPRCRQRAQAILLSARRYSIPQIAAVLEVERRAVSNWIDRWQALGLLGLYDKPRTGRPPIFTAEEAVLVRQIVDQEPRQLKQARARLAQITGKPASCHTLKRVLKNSSMPGNAAAAR